MRPPKKDEQPTAALGYLKPWDCRDPSGHEPHPLSDATFGSDTARHAGSEALIHQLPQATAACCRQHGCEQTVHTQEMTIRSHGPTLRGLLMAAGPFDPQTTTVVLFLGGCGAPAAANVVPIASGYLNQGAALCVVDYRGFGCSAGAPSERGLYSDGERMLAHLIHHLGVPLKHIVLHGYALGATVAAELAARWSERHMAPFGGLVLDRPMASVLAPVASDQETGLGYLTGLLHDGDADGCDGLDDSAALHDDHISHKLERIDPNTFTVLLSGDKDALGVSGDHLNDTLQRCGFHVEQAHLCADSKLSCYELFSCSEGCISKLCQNIEA